MPSIIQLIIIVFLVFIVLTIVKKLFKLLFYGGIAILILILLNTYFIYQDVADLRENFAASTKNVILVDDKQVLTGFLITNEINFITNEKLDEFSSNLENEDFEKVLGESYKLLIFDVNIISDLKTNIEIGDNTISNDFAVSVLKSNKPFEMLKGKNINQNDLEITRNEAENNVKVKAALFGIILSENILSSKNPLFFFSEFKKGSIIIYPETALFKTVKFIPLTFFENTGKKIFGKAKEKVKTLIIEETEWDP